jgi:phage terminase small subunit
MSKLTAKQDLFVLEYLVDLNATQAAIRAGYAKKTATAIGYENLIKPHIASAIQIAKSKRSERTKIDADYVLKHNAAMLEADIADILDDDGSYLPVKQWPKIWRQMLAGMDIQKLFDRHGSKGKRIGEVIKIKFIDRLKALEMLGKHTDVQAYKEKVDVNLGGQPDNPLVVLAKAVQGAALPVKK